MAAIVKYGDDLRHELLAFQFMVRLKEIWASEHVPVFVRPINILVLSNNSGRRVQRAARTIRFSLLRFDRTDSQRRVSSPDQEEFQALAEELLPT